MGKGLRVVIADRDVEFRRQLTTVLTEAGGQVIAETANATEAVWLATRWRPDAVVVGADVGRWDIAVAIREIKSCGRSTRIVVAADGPIGPEKVLRAGADVFVIKDDDGAARVLAALMG